MKIWTVIALAATGGLLYLNNRNGRNLTLGNLGQTARDLFGRARTEAVGLKDRGERKMHEVAQKVAQATDTH